MSVMSEVSIRGARATTCARVLCSPLTCRDLLGAPSVSVAQDDHQCDGGDDDDGADHHRQDDEHWEVLWKHRNTAGRQGGPLENGVTAERMGGDCRNARGCFFVHFKAKRGVFAVSFIDLRIFLLLYLCWISVLNGVL